MGIGPIGLGGIFTNGKMKLVTRASMEKTVFANPKLTDTFQQGLSAEAAKPFLDIFGKAAKKIKLNPEHTYEYINAHSAAQIVDKTTGKNVILAMQKVKRPVGKFIKGLFGAWKNY